MGFTDTYLSLSCDLFSVALIMGTMQYFLFEPHYFGVQWWARLDGLVGQLMITVLWRQMHKFNSCHVLLHVLSSMTR